MDIGRGYSFVGHYGSRDELESKAPRKPDVVAHTDNATYTWDGKEWILVTLKQYVTFKVLGRAHVTGRGYVTVVHNPDLLPVDRDRSAVCKGQFRLPIHGIELTLTLTDPPRVEPHWGLLTYEETIGEEITVRMYPDEKDGHIEEEK